jgi:hypothetical protein
MRCSVPQFLCCRRRRFKRALARRTLTRRRAKSMLGSTPAPRPVRRPKSPQRQLATDSLRQSRLPTPKSDLATFLKRQGQRLTKPSLARAKPISQATLRPARPRLRTRARRSAIDVRRRQQGVVAFFGAAKPLKMPSIEPPRAPRCGPRNRVYLGEINHRNQSYPGEHPSILDHTLFDAVQAKLARHIGDISEWPMNFDVASVRVVTDFDAHAVFFGRYQIQRAVILLRFAQFPGAEQLIGVRLDSWPSSEASARQPTERQIGFTERPAYFAARRARRQRECLQCRQLPAQSRKCLIRRRRNMSR